MHIIVVQWLKKRFAEFIAGLVMMLGAYVAEVIVEPLRHQWQQMFSEQRQVVQQQPIAPLSSEIEALLRDFQAHMDLQHQVDALTRYEGL